MADENLSDVNIEPADEAEIQVDSEITEPEASEPEVNVAAGLEAAALDEGLKATDSESSESVPTESTPAESEPAETKQTESKQPEKKAPEKKEPEKKEPENLVVEGYEFLSPEDAKKAEIDKQKIDIIGKKIHSTKVTDLEAVYEKAISNKIFSTPVGWYYLARLRDKLYEAGVKEEDLIPIPINTKITKVDLKDEYHPRQYIVPPPPKKKKDVKAVFVVLIAMNLILVAMVVAMFVIAVKSETDNIINYKQNVTNRFAEWEDSLKEREKAVRIKERDLMIQDDTPYLEEMGLDESDLDEITEESDKNEGSE